MIVKATEVDLGKEHFSQRLNPRTAITSFSLDLRQPEATRDYLEEGISIS
jgi:hypothetical protein